MQLDISFPKEYFIELSADSFKMGRLTLILVKDYEKRPSYIVEIDIVLKENQKIWCHVGRLSNISNSEEAISLAVQKLSSFINKQTS